MQGNVGRDTKPEMSVRRVLHARGLRYRVDYRPEQSIRSRPDLTFSRARVVVYIDGCFWHGCPVHHTVAATNASYWREKLEANRERDRRSSAAFRDLGWTVLRFWEHEEVSEVADQIERAVRPSATQICQRISS